MQTDLMRLREFIAIKNPQTTIRISQRLIASIKRLVDQPEMGVNVEKLLGVRDLISGGYIVRYIVLEEVVYILRIGMEKNIDKIKRVNS